MNKCKHFLSITLIVFSTLDLYSMYIYLRQAWEDLAVLRMAVFLLESSLAQFPQTLLAPGW